MNTPYFSVIVPTLNEEKFIGSLLRSLVAQTFKDFEVIICNSPKSTDNIENVVSSFKTHLTVNLVTAPVGGISEQRNFGASLAKSDRFIFFDADVAPDTSFFAEIKTGLEKKHFTLATSWNEPISSLLIDHLMFGLHNIIYLELRKYITPGAVGTFIYASRGIFEKVGGFSVEMSGYAEDFEFIARAHKAGGKYYLFKKPTIKFSVRRLNKDGRLKFIKKMVRSFLVYNLNGRSYKSLQRFKNEHTMGEHTPQKN